VHRRGERVLIKNAAIYHFQSAGESFRSDLGLHGPHVRLCAGGEIVQHPYAMAAS
jgi:hypothetical protein